MKPRASLLLLFALPALVAGAVANTSRVPPAGAAMAQHATIYRDEYGVPHIYGDSAAAASFGFGYAQAQDHLSQMRQDYLTAAGRLAETGLASTTSTDAFVHLLDVPETGQAALAAMSSGDRERIDAFAAGINQYIAEQPSNPSWMLPVEPYEVLAWVQYESLSPEYGIATSKLPGNAALPAALDSSSGSNMWAVGAAKSSLGVPVLQGDPHLPWQGGTQWYEAHLNYPGVNVAGSTFFGWPFIAMGATDNIAWTMTDNSPDNADLYQETLNPANQLQYLRDGAWVNAKAVTTTIKWLGHPDQHVTNYYSVHGPVVRVDATYAYAAAMPSFDLTGMAAQALHLVEAPDAASFFVPTDVPLLAKWNITVVDHAHIMYLDNMRMAVKPQSIDWDLPVDGSVSANDWTGFLTYAQLPQKVDPSWGYLQNANNSPWTTAPDLVRSDYPNYVAPGNGMGERARRAVEWLTSKPAFGVTDMEAMSMDDLSWSGRGLAALIGPDWTDNPRPDPDGSMAAGVALLSSWDATQSKTSTAVALAQAWMADFFTRSPSFGRENVPAYASMTSADKTKLLDALTQAITNVRAAFGSINPVWGDVHKIPRGAMYPVGGGGKAAPALRIADTSSFTGGVYQATNGSSYQFVVAMTTPPQFWSIRPYGESEDPASPHYADQTVLFANNQFKLMPFTLADVTAHSGAPQVLTYYPASVGGLAFRATPVATGTGGASSWLGTLVYGASLLAFALLVAAAAWRMTHARR